MKKILEAIPDSLLRVLIVFGIFLVGVICIRTMIPSSLKNTEEHVKATVERETAHAVRYAGSDACADCHEQGTAKRKGYHRNLACETCHGAAKVHVENPSDQKPVKPTKREQCAICHAYDPSRPTGFPQINPAAHNPLKLCMECHDPHDPKPPHTPQECQSCHQQIARTKSISRHVQLECTTCHTVQEQHKTSPRSALPTVPTERAFCGKCHSKESTARGMPKVDMATHGEKYLCWQCHYPHMPEVD